MRNLVPRYNGTPDSMRTWESGQNGATYYYALDLSANNVQGLFGTAGSVAARYDYSPFGEAYTSSATVTSPLRFAARYKNGREAVVSVPGWEGGEPEYCKPWFPSMIDQAFSLLGQEFAFSSMYESPRMHKIGDASSAVAKTRVMLVFVAQENDYRVFEGCPTSIRHEEREGEFVGTWEVKHGRGFWARRVVPRGGFRDFELQVQQYYIGTVRTHYGVTPAKGWVTCGTGEASLQSLFFLEDLTRF